MIRSTLCSLVAVVFAPALVLAGGFSDDFSHPKMEGRKALRGEWKFENNEASCVSDPELYKKFKNHGPILRWPCSFTDGVIEFEFKPSKCQRIVITFNNDEGHVFRIALADEKRTRVFGWAGSSKETDAETITKEGVPTVDSIEGKWVKGKIAFTDGAAKVVLGGFSADLKHASAAREKGEFTISFASGACAVRKVELKAGQE